MAQHDAEKLDSISKRLKYLVETMGVKQSHMAQKLGMSPSGLHYILNNEIKFSKNAKKIAEYLNVNEEWLENGTGEIYEENITIKTYKIPLYYPDQLKLHYSSQVKLKPNTTDFMLTTTLYPNKMIALYLTESYFNSKFEVGDRVAFECTEHFKDGDILLTYIATDHTTLIKHGYFIEGELFLTSADSAPKKFNAKAGDVLIGCYRECLKKQA